jgi:peptidoglycan-N-acetylglucosamine deacetylase
MKQGILVCAVVLPAAVLVAGCPSSSPSSDPTCTGAAALSAAPIFGTSLGTKQLALTFDDGPASRTLELSTYLKGKGIRAGFFINGFRVPAGAAGTNLLAQLVADGHVIANHTQTHVSLTSPPPAAATMIKELSDTDVIIAPFVPNNRFMFRAPFGDWNQNAYNTLQASAMSKYVGHIEWEYGGERTANSAADWACWQQNPKLSSKDCGDLYVKEIDTSATQRGIVLMHDADYGDNTNGAVGNTIDMVKYMVPILQAKGYTFKRIDEVPTIAALLPALPPQDAGATDAALDGAKDGSTADGSTPTQDSGPNTTPTTPPPSPTSPPESTPGPCPEAGVTTAHRRAHAH